MRSRLSPTALSARPTIEKEGRPPPSCTSTSTAAASRPMKATVSIRAMLGAWLVLAKSVRSVAGELDRISL